jgi:DNA (cytosine-5)-methyltransferase 1
MSKNSKLITNDGNIRRYANSEVIEVFNPEQIAYIDYENGYGHGKRVSDIAFTLTVKGSNGSQVYKQKDLRIRKLTPKECRRLMGFADEDFEKANEVNNDNQLYKQAGNSIVVQVLEAIFKEML